MAGRLSLISTRYSLAWARRYALHSLGHHFEVTGLLAYSEAAFNASPRALVVSVAAESFDFQDHLAPNVEAALPEVIDYIRKIVCGADSGLSVQKGA